TMRHGTAAGRRGSGAEPIHVERGAAAAEIGAGGALHPLLQAEDTGRPRRGGGSRLVEREDVDHAIEFGGLRLGLLDGGIGLFDQRRIVLGHLVELPHRRVDLLDRRGLLLAEIGRASCRESLSYAVIAVYCT